MNDFSRKIVTLGEDGMLGISQHLIPEFLSRFDTSHSLPKKVHELLIGYIFCQFLEEKLREEAIIGFPAAEGWKRHSTEKPLMLDWLMAHHHELISDTDVDIKISSGGLTTKYQITRYVNAPNGIAHRSLYDLITKKCKNQQPDRHLHLVVSIENTPTITEQELRNIVGRITVPYRAIFLISKASAKPGHFSYVRLYPSPTIGKEIIVPIPA